MVETDAPFLAPVPYRGKPNRPAWVAVVGEAVAEARGVKPEDLAASSTEATRVAFALD
jgi:TatD DNase family protein